MNLERIRTRRTLQAFLPCACLLVWSLTASADSDPVRLEIQPRAAGDAPDRDPADAEDVVDTDPAVRQMYEGMLLAQDGEYEQAIPLLEAVIRQDPSLLGAWETLGWAYWNTDRKQDALALWERLLALAPHEALPYNLLARLATRDGDLERALDLYRRSLRLDEKQFETAFAMAQVLLWSGYREEAVAQLQRVHAWDPDRLDVQIELAWALFANEQYEEALRHWDAVCAELPGEPDFLTARAEVLIYMGELEGAESALRDVLEIEPDHTKALNLLMEIAARRGRPEDVIAALKTVIALAEEDRARAPLLLQLAHYLRILNRRDPEEYPITMSLEAAAEAVRLDPEDLQARLFYAEALLMDKQFARAGRAFAVILEDYNPMNLRARVGLMESYLARNLLDEAERQLRDNLLSFNPRDPYRHVIRARIHYARGHTRQAYEALDKLEEEGLRGAVFNVLYHGLSPSEWTAMPSVRQVKEHWTALREEGFSFITPSEFEEHFESLPPIPQKTTPWLRRLILRLRKALGEEEPEVLPPLSERSPPKIACIHFDDGLRTSFRWGTPVLEEMGLRAAMSLAVGLIEDRDFYIASWEEIRQAQARGVWEMGSHLMDSSLLGPIDEEGREAGILANRLWLREERRLETLREFQARLRYEYGRSKEIMQRELGLAAEDILFQVPPMGDIGQELGSNIRLFNVPHINLNEAEIHYRMGFIQSPYGYALRTDHPQLLQRYEPDRDTTAREVVVQAYRGHPVFLARHMRAEFAALEGLAHKAMDTLELLRRDGYPEELLDELNAFVRSRLAARLPLPLALRPDDPPERVPWISPRHPLLGLEYRETKANVQIEERHASGFAGLMLNPRLALRAETGGGRIKQTVVSNIFYEIRVPRTTRERVVRRDGEGNRTVEETSVTTYTLVTTNRKEVTHYRMDEQKLGGQLSYAFVDGSVGSVEVARHRLEGDVGEHTFWSYAVEYLWRPTVYLHTALRYQHDKVPSARRLIPYNSVLLRGQWDVRDRWSAEGVGQYAAFRDANSMLTLGLENLWQVSVPQDVWLGIASRLTTSDEDSPYYWTPYWEQRHHLIGRLRRAYPDFYASLQIHWGWQHERARPEVLEEYRTREVRAEEEGWYPGESPEQGWEMLVGVSANVGKRWKSGWEIGADATVNALREYIERNVLVRLLYRF